MDRSGTSPRSAYRAWKPFRVVAHLADAVRLALDPHDAVARLQRGLEERARGGLGVEQRDLPVAGHRGLPTVGDLVAEGRDEGVVRRSAVLAEQVGQDDVGQRARQPREDVRGSPLPASVGVVEVALHGVGVDDVHRAAVEGRAEVLGQPHVAALDLLVRLRAVDPGEVEDGVDVAQGLAEQPGVGERLAPQAHGLDAVDGAQPAGGVPPEEAVGSGDRDAAVVAHEISSLHPSRPTGADHRPSSQPGSCSWPNHIISSRRDAAATGPDQRPAVAPADTSSRASGVGTCLGSRRPRILTSSATVRCSDGWSTTRGGLSARESRTPAHRRRSGRAPAALHPCPGPRRKRRARTGP